MTDLRKVKVDDEFKMDMGNGYIGVVKALKVENGVIVDSKRIALNRATDEVISVSENEAKEVETKEEVKEVKKEVKKPATTKKAVTKK